MNAAVVHAYGAPPRYTTFEDPIPQGSEQLVTVTAAGLRNIVKGLAAGTRYGADGALPLRSQGVDGVGRLKDGTRVYFGLSRAPLRHLGRAWPRDS